MTKLTRLDFEASEDMEAVAIRWLDTCHEDELTKEEILKMKPEEATTYGRLLVNDKDKVIVASTEFKDETYRSVTCIPKVCVLKVIKLEEEKQNETLEEKKDNKRTRQKSHSKSKGSRSKAG